MKRILAIVFLVVMVALAGCAQFCQNKGQILNSMAVAQAGYDAYVKAAQAGSFNNTALEVKSAQAQAYIILADQILAMAGPYIQNGILQACPPDVVVEALATKTAEAAAVKPPLVVNPPVGGAGQPAPATQPGS
jgi:hypothetical protein